MNDPDPIYDYIPGQGWVATNERRVKAKDRAGRECWVIDRKPVKGDWHLNIYGIYDFEHCVLEIRHRHPTRRLKNTLRSDYSYVVVEYI